MSSWTPSGRGTPAGKQAEQGGHVLENTEKEVHRKNKLHIVSREQNRSPSWKDLSDIFLYT